MLRSPVLRDPIVRISKTGFLLRTGHPVRYRPDLLLSGQAIRCVTAAMFNAYPAPEGSLFSAEYRFGR